MITPLRRLFRYLGTVRGTILITALSIVLSVLIDVSVYSLCKGGPSTIPPVFLAALIPALIAPPFSYFILDLLNRLDRSEHERSQLVSELQAALLKIEVLDGLLPICASCKRIRDENGQWHQIESYIQDRSRAQFSHGICPDCAQKFYADYLSDET
jgi:hypothetical protein